MDASVTNERLIGIDQLIVKHKLNNNKALVVGFVGGSLHGKASLVSQLADRPVLQVRAITFSH